MPKQLKLILCILLPLSIGAIGGIATASSVKGWYLTLHKPVFNPPNYLFGPVWTLLYILMGISFYLILQTQETSLNRKKSIQIFLFQLVLNLCWSFIFFKFHYLAAAFFEIVLLWISILVMIIQFYKVNRIAAYLQIPYILWVSFASLLSGTLWLLN